MFNSSTTETVIYEIDNITKKVKGRMFMARRVVTLVDCRVAGISGDMFLGALIDLGADSEKVGRRRKPQRPHRRVQKSRD
ncbi:DUF111 family protein [Candidatus Bathyarchaeota archaeon]|nr:MAG: DUF111 family protein [Candidatus Bathyarchaeota archaeon]